MGPIDAGHVNTVQVEKPGMEGVRADLLPVIESAGGPVLRMLRADNPHFTAFGEIYFSLVNPGAVKAWKKHRIQEQNFACPCGLILLVAYDERRSSSTFGKLASFTLGLPDNYRLLHIPPGIRYGFTALSDCPAVLANCANMVHNPDEAENLPPDSPLVPYSWSGIF
ncbi:MAG: dTDP-4-dehydrorhamnose 3,5-epimerase family protein [Desulfovibrio sp.]|jgi:dTDP-4-dehydrorhamnose 3,5-epimerase|nr:dTDP-4-dehydrorhamnose 3,5-epimerase family protein [Desulfovibrio sp.]